MGQLPSNCTLPSYCAIYAAICGDANNDDDINKDGSIVNDTRTTTTASFDKPYWFTPQSFSPSTVTEVTCHHTTSNRLMTVDTRSKETLTTAPPGYGVNSGWLVEYDHGDAMDQEQPIIKLKSAYTQQYVNILQDGSVVCNDRIGTKYAMFRVHRLEQNSNRYRFESVEFANKFLCISNDRVIVWEIEEDENCEFDVFCSTEQTPFYSMMSDTTAAAVDYSQTPLIDVNNNEDDNNEWIDSISGLSSFIKKKRDPSDNLNPYTQLPLTVAFWNSVSAKKAANMNAILTALQEFIGNSNFSLRLVLWERVDSKKSQMPTTTALPKLLYQTMIEYMNQKDKKREKPTWQHAESFMKYLAEQIKNMDTFSEKHKEQLTKEEFARNLDNWMTAVVERYKKN